MMRMNRGKAVYDSQLVDESAANKLSAEITTFDCFFCQPERQLTIGAHK
jgi:hypothetical protein